MRIDLPLLAAHFVSQSAIFVDDAHQQFFKPFDAGGFGIFHRICGCLRGGDLPLSVGANACSGQDGCCQVTAEPYRN